MQTRCFRDMQECGGAGGFGLIIHLLVIRGDEGTEEKTETIMVLGTI